MKTTISPFSNSKLIPYLTCKDYTVSRETFSLLKDKELEMLITLPKPSLENLPKYYESEDYISHTDSDKNFIDRLYQKAKNYSIKQKIKLIRKHKTQNTKLQTPNSLLDIGCGTGDFLSACQNNGYTIVGVEPNKKARVLSKSKLGILTSNSENYNNLHPKVYDSINVIENQQFDVITMWHVLEHVPNLEEYIKQVKELLKPNGTLFIAVPNYKSYDANHYKEFWAAFDVPRHLWHFSKKSIKVLFEKENFSIKKIMPMKLDSFYVSLLSEKYKTGKSKLIKAFFIGLLSNIKAISTKEYSSLIYIIKNK